MVNRATMRKVAVRAAGALVLAIVASAALARPPLARMDDDDRRRLRHELRQQERAPGRSERDRQPGGAEDQARSPADSPYRLAPPPRQDRQDQWQPAPGQAWQQRDPRERPRLSPEERQQLREQLRQRQDAWRR